MDNTKYNKLIESIEINNIELISLNCYKNNNFDPKKKSNINIGFHHEVEEVNIKGLNLLVNCHFEVIAFYGDENNGHIKKDDIDSENILFNIEFVLELKYSLEIEDVQDIMLELKNEVNQFVHQNVPINAWPYARETISSMTTRMGLPPLVIPALKNIPFN